MSVSSSQEKPRQVIYVYQDEGASKPYVEAIAKMTKQFAGRDLILRGITAKQIITTDWEAEAVLLVMPGGADLPYVRKLRGRGNRRIRTFVEDGGAYLGICAGAYYGSGYVEFAGGTILEVKGARELQFFKGHSVGPHHLLSPTKKVSRIANILMGKNLDEKTSIYYNGGGYFEGAETDPDTKILATYSDCRAAIIQTKVGKGKAILSGVHFEVERVTDSRLEETKNKISLQRENLILQIFRALGIADERYSRSR